MKIFTTVLFLLLAFSANAQKIEKIFVNLYTDSLKKGTHNYISVDGLLSNGKYMPLDSTKIKFRSDNGFFDGNSLVVPADSKAEKFKIRVSLREDSSKFEEFELYVKKVEDPPLKSEKEIMGEMKANRKKKNKIKDKSEEGNRLREQREKEKAKS